jgi:plasmid stabilization system protein ParE
MKYTFSIRPNFEQSLWEIEYYLYQNEGEARCDKIINSIYEKIDYIVQNPLHFPIFHILHKTGSFRKAVHYKTYLIIYEVTGYHIEFVDVVHGKKLS